MLYRIFSQNNIKCTSTFIKRNLHYYSNNIFDSATSAVIRNLRNGRLLEATSVHTSKLRYTGRVLFNFTCNRKLSVLEINTNVANNVYLYKYERERLYTFLNWFAPFQCIFWTTIGYFFYQTLPEKEPTKSRLNYYKENFLSTCVSITTIILGVSTMFLIWAYSARSIKAAILKKGGEHVIFMTYNPVKSNATMTIPIEKVSCAIHRKEMVHYLTVKVKGKWFFYIFDAGGNFYNSKLFDSTIGAERNLKLY